MKNIFCEIVLAGVASIFGLDEIKKIANKKGYSVRFVETEYMIKSNLIDENGVEVTEAIDISENSLYLPLNEYWVSYGHKESIDRISDRAYKAGRSKKYLSYLLGINNLDYCKTLSISEARKYIQEGKKVLIKPDSYYSGHGVKVIGKKNEKKLDFFLEQANQITDDAKRVLMLDKSKAEIWEYIDGDEYSADILIYEGKFSILRLCKKKIVLIDDMPCVIAYVTVLVPERIRKVVSNWTSVLFDNGNISFCQVDFIEEKETGRVILIDFSCRVGGGMKDMFRKYKSNIYAAAIRSIIQNDIVELSNSGIYQFNVLPTKKGMLVDDNYKVLDGELIKYKSRNTLINRIGGSANDRLGCIVGDAYSEEIFNRTKNNLLIGDEYIK